MQWQTVIIVLGVVSLVLAIVAFKALERWLDARGIGVAGGGPDAVARDDAFTMRTGLAGPLLTQAELRFFEVLERVLRHPSEPGGTPQLRVMCKVRLIDLVVPATDLDDKVALATRNKLISKHVDFVLVDPATLVPRVVIELDDRSHRGTKASARDADKDAALAGAGVRVVRVPARAGYEDAEVAGLLRDTVR